MININEMKHFFFDYVNLHSFMMMIERMNHVCQKIGKLLFQNFTDFLFLVMTEHEKLIADLGRPRLGEKNTIRIRIRESKEFKV